MTNEEIEDAVSAFRAALKAGVVREVDCITMGSEGFLFVAGVPGSAIESGVSGEWYGEEDKLQHTIVARPGGVKFMSVERLDEYLARCPQRESA